MGNEVGRAQPITPVESLAHRIQEYAEESCGDHSLFYASDVSAMELATILLRRFGFVVSLETITEEPFHLPYSTDRYVRIRAWTKDKQSVDCYLAELTPIDYVLLRSPTLRPESSSFILQPRC